MLHVFLNNEIVREDAARVSAGDRGFLLGDGLFETMRAYGGRVFRLGAHLQRLRSSAEFLRIKVPISDRDIEGAIADLIRLNGCAEAYVRITLTRGLLDRGLSLETSSPPTMCIVARPLVPYPEEQYRKGQRLIVSSFRQNSASPLSRHKTISYLLHLLARQEAADAGANGAILLNEHGQVAEESVSNIFIVKDGHTVTPPVHCGLLPGVTRAAVIELANAENLPLEELPVGAGELFEADEIFLTNSLMEIMPVRSVDRRPLREEAPGPLTSRFQSLYRALVERETR